ncbi:hypothetical protein BGM19_01255 [Streptomyces agglomeratus]|uniref:phospholipase effector Tle1 domain-containing protein n=1 Tax=Streptomyces agglomeratus TaxID=285458 RepID=UPI0008526770|nr:DUF2235 domain-containing protein [Streptomyces agglomeratus]OEJ56862.1 hypothetical protein BGM19_01255 [Streptomyces agglomeratus]
MAKRLIVCCDGTWNIADQPNTTNVLKVAMSIPAEADGVEQLVSYHCGVGASPWMRLRGGAFGMGLSANVREAYLFLIENYEPGDKLYLFGFSRGAFTARSLAGLVRNCGILRQERADKIEKAWAMYRNRKKPTSRAARLFRRENAHETGIHFIGVWDTVGALGIPGPRWLPRRGAFHDTELSSSVKGAFHALAIDEQRRPFRPTLWHQQHGAAENGQELKQVWFAGVHKDIGGGYPERGLSDITLLWMIRQASRYGLVFDPSEDEPSEMPPDSSIFQVPPEPDSRGEIHNSRKGFYRLAPRLHRPIGKAANKQRLLDGCEYLSQTANDRYDEDASYRPRKGPRRLHDYRTQDEVRLEPVPLTVDYARLRPPNRWTVEQTQVGGPGNPATEAVVHEDGCQAAPAGDPELDIALDEALEALARPGASACQECAAAEVLTRR